MIAMQVFPQELGALDRNPGTPHARALAALKNGTQHLAFDDSPLPEEVKSLNVTKVIVRSAMEQSFRTNCRTVSAAALPSAPTSLSVRDFRDFGEAAAKSLVSPYQSVSDDATKLRASKAGRCKKGASKLWWECIFGSYMVAYYNGKFVDRNGGIQSKPKLGMTVSNEVITAATKVLLDAMFDFTSIDAPFVRAPIVYTNVLLPIPTSLTAMTWATGKGSFANKGTYGYVVSATNGNGESLPSVEVQASVNVTDTVAFSWASVPGATSYNLYRTANPGSYTSPTLVTSTTAPNYTDVGKTPTSGSPPATNTAISSVTWFTKDANTPTLATLAISVGLFDPKAPKDINRILMKSDPTTMDAPRVCVARLIGGWSGDAAQPLVGTIVRLVGGANLGFTFGLGALGKFSFGDNETLAKLIDAVVETFVQRLGELTTETILYGNSNNAGAPLQSVLALAETLTDCQGKTP